MKVGGHGKIGRPKVRWNNGIIKYLKEKDWGT